MTARPARRARRRLALADDGIIDPIAVEIAAQGARTVALTPAERQLAAARILARGGTPYVISQRLQVSGTTALTLARCQAHDVMTRGLVLTKDRSPVATGPPPTGQAAGAIRDEPGERSRALPGQPPKSPAASSSVPGPRACLPGRYPLAR